MNLSEHILSELNKNYIKFVTRDDIKELVTEYSNTLR